MEQIIATVRAFDGALVLVPEPGSDFPELAWGDAFFYYAPDGQPPKNVQPYGNIVTKDYPDDTASDLDPPGRWRVNIHVGRTTFQETRSVRHSVDSQIRQTCRSVGCVPSGGRSRPRPLLDLCWTV
ncbi:DUF6194 family protein [Streptomyces sp. NPDC002851]